MKRFLFFCLFCAIIFSGCEKNEDSPITSTTHESETITTNTLWKAANNPHIIKGYVKVTSGALTLEPGVLVKFDAGASLEIGGTNASLIAVGTVEDSITFTSLSQSPQPGDWDYIKFKQGAIDCKMEYCVVKYGGANPSWGMIDVSGNALLSIKTCTISYSENVAVEAEDDGNAFVAFEGNILLGTEGKHVMKIRGKNVPTIGIGNSFTTSNNFGILVTGSSSSYNYVDENSTWKKHNAPYYIEDDIIIRNGATLTIEAGTTLKFDDGQKVQVGTSTNGTGRLIARGTSDSRIIFTSASATPQKGDWRGVEFNSQALTGNELVYCDLLYGGGYQAIVDVNPCGTNNPLVENCNISNSKLWGIYKRKSGGVYASPSLVNNSFTGNTSGDIGQDN